VPGAGFVIADHAARAGAMRTEAEASAAVMAEEHAAKTLETQTQLHEYQSIPSAIAGRISNFADATIGAVRGLIGGSEGWAAQVDGYRQDALGQGLTSAQAELYAYDKGIAGMISASPDIDHRDRLVDNVLSEFEGLPRAGDSALKMIERAVSLTDAGARGPLGNLKQMNESLELDRPREERGLVGRMVR
jgi:hypothetical protein